MDSDWEDDETEVYPVRRILGLDLVYTGLGFAAGVLEAAGEAVHDLQHLVGGRLNFIREGEEFHDQAAREIETLIGGEES